METQDFHQDHPCIIPKSPKYILEHHCKYLTKEKNTPTEVSQWPYRCTKSDPKLDVDCTSHDKTQSPGLVEDPCAFKSGRNARSMRKKNKGQNKDEEKEGFVHIHKSYVEEKPRKYEKLQNPPWTWPKRPNTSVRGENGKLNFSTNSKQDTISTVQDTLVQENKKYGDSFPELSRYITNADDNLMPLHRVNSLPIKQNKSKMKSSKIISGDEQEDQVYNEIVNENKSQLSNDRNTQKFNVRNNQKSNGKNNQTAIERNNHRPNEKKSQTATERNNQTSFWRNNKIENESNNRKVNKRNNQTSNERNNKTANERNSQKSIKRNNRPGNETNNQTTNASKKRTERFDKKQPFEAKEQILSVGDPGPAKTFMSNFGESFKKFLPPFTNDKEQEQIISTRSGTNVDPEMAACWYNIKKYQPDFECKRYCYCQCDKSEPRNIYKSPEAKSYSQFAGDNDRLNNRSGLMADIEKFLSLPLRFLTSKKLKRYYEDEKEKMFSLHSANSGTNVDPQIESCYDDIKKYQPENACGCEKNGQCQIGQRMPAHKGGKTFKPFVKKKSSSDTNSLRDKKRNSNGKIVKKANKEIKTCEPDPIQSRIDEYLLKHNPRAATLSPKVLWDVIGCKCDDPDICGCKCCCVVSNDDLCDCIMCKNYLDEAQLREKERYNTRLSKSDKYNPKLSKSDQTGVSSQKIVRCKSLLTKRDPCYPVLCKRGRCNSWLCSREPRSAVLIEKFPKLGALFKRNPKIAKLSKKGPNKCLKSKEDPNKTLLNDGDQSKFKLGKKDLYDKQCKALICEHNPCDDAYFRPYIYHPVCSVEDKFDAVCGNQDLNRCDYLINKYSSAWDMLDDRGRIGKKSAEVPFMEKRNKLRGNIHNKRSDCFVDERRSSTKTPQTLKNCTIELEFPNTSLPKFMCSPINSATKSKTQNKCNMCIKAQVSECNPCIDKPKPCMKAQVCGGNPCIDKCNPCIKAPICEGNPCIDKYNSCMKAQVCGVNPCIDKCNPCIKAQICEGNPCIDKYNSCMKEQVCGVNPCIEKYNPCMKSQVCGGNPCIDKCNPCMKAQVCRVNPCIDKCNPCMKAQVCGGNPCIDKFNPCMKAQVLGCNHCMDSTRQSHRCTMSPGSEVQKTANTKSPRRARKLSQQRC